MIDLESLHQTIFRRVHDALHGTVDEATMAGPVWLATEQAAKDIAASLSTHCDSPVGWGGHLPGKIEP